MDGNNRDLGGAARAGTEAFQDGEVQAIMAVLSSYYLYRRASHATLTHSRRKSFYALPRHHQNLLSSPPIYYLSTLSSVDTCIERNAVLAEAILRASSNMFGMDLSSMPNWQNLADQDDMDKARSTLKQFYRDWSAEGASERERCYGPIISAIEQKFSKMEGRENVRVLVPGAGLGRLPYELVTRGFYTEGNEFSYHMLTASNFVLNSTHCANEYIIHPFVASFSNHRNRDAHLRGVSIPDVHPAAGLMREDVKGRPADRFGMSAGEFVGCYGGENARESFDAVATCFFIDTAPNVISYIEAIWNTLKEGGMWVNLGPLLWHFENKNDTKNSEDTGGVAHKHGHGHGHQGGHGHPHHSDKDQDDFGKVSLELTLEEVLILVQKKGFKVEERRTVQTGYIQDEESMMNYDYKAEFWVATKIARDL